MKGDENFWEMADIGPCGVCTEIHYVNDSELIQNSSPKLNQIELLRNSIEIWNLVFIQYEKYEPDLI